MEEANDQPQYEITLRPVTADDREFLIGVISDVRRDELALTMWDDQQKRWFIEHQLDAQSNHYQAVYPRSKHEIILSNGESVGRLFTDRGTSEIAILDITVLTQFRRRGIATFLIKALQSEAEKTERAVRIFVESYNPSRHLFERLGFKIAEVQEHNLKYVWTP